MGHLLLLFDIDVCNVEPDVAKVGRGFAHLGKDDSGVTDVAFVSQHSTDAVGSPYVFGVVANHLTQRA